MGGIIYPHVRFIDVNWGVQTLEYFQGSWKQYSLTESRAASNNSVHTYVSSYDHVNYIGMSGHVHEVEMFLDSPSVINDLTKLAGSSTTAAAESPLTGYWDGEARHHVNYIDSDGHVHELYIRPPYPYTSWKDNDLTKLAGSSTTAAARSPLTGYWDFLSGVRQHVNYIDSDGHVHELYNTPTISWKDNDLTKLAGSSTTAAQTSTLGGFALSDDTSQHVYYFEQSGNVHELYTSSGSWKDKDISNGITPTARSPLAGSASPFYRKN
jgi:hypothetical protein